MKNNPKISVQKIYIFIFLMLAVTTAQQSDPWMIRAKYCEPAPVLDGKMDDPCWQKVDKISNFTQQELTEGAPATEKTEIGIVYTKKALYIGIWCYDSEPEKIVAKEMKRDFSTRGEDNVEIVIDTYHDRRNSYHFIINPNGARQDELVTDEGRGRNKDWNGVWDIRTKITKEGWFAELEIPFTTLKFSNKHSQTWGINFERNISRKNERSLWQGWSRNYDLEQVSQAGILTGLENITSGNFVEVLPYVTAGVEKETGEKTGTVFNVGGDFNYLVTSNLKLNGTLFTDFSQVESDRAIINLSRFSVYYPEKRGFFLEGRDAFAFGQRRGLPTMFYSRQIGIKDGEEVPIIGGARLIGKVGSTKVGALSMQTQAVDGEPTTNYSVLRMKQDVGNQSNVGMIMTAKNSSAVHNYVYGVDANYVTSHFLGDKNLAIGGSVTGSSTTNENSNDVAYQAYLSSDNDKVEFDMAFARVGNNFDPQIGFKRRENYKLIYSELQFNVRPKFLPWIRVMEFKPLDVDAYLTDDTNELESLSSEWRFLGFGTKSGDWFEYNVQYFYDRLDEPFEIHDGVILPIGGYSGPRHEFQLYTYGGRQVSAFAEVNFGKYYTGTRTEYSVGSILKINKHFNMRGDYEYNQLYFPEGAFETHAFSGRAEYAFTTQLYSSFFGQWNNEDRQVLLNFRVNWIPVIGSDFYLAINQLYDANGSFKVLNTTILSKIIWRFVL